MEISIRPEWDNIEKARNFVAEFCTQRELSPEARDATVMIVSELSENAIKYGNFSSGESAIKAIVSVEEDSVTVEVINPVGPESREYLSELDKTIQWIRGFQDPFEAYGEKLRELSKRMLSDHSSSLGLARIAYEAQAILDFFVDEEDLLNVSAIAPRN
jgi:hypothetical protein